MIRTTLNSVVTGFMEGYDESVPSEQHKTVAEAPGLLLKKLITQRAK
jgi:hypothetical protein